MSNAAGLAAALKKTTLAQLRSVLRSTSTMLLPSVRAANLTLAGSAAHGSAIASTSNASFALGRCSSTPALFVTCTYDVAPPERRAATSKPPGASCPAKAASGTCLSSIPAKILVTPCQSISIESISAAAAAGGVLPQG